MIRLPNIRLCAVVITMVVLLFSCRKEEQIVPSTSTTVTGGESGEICGFFLLNEGNMGSNKSTLDYFDYQTGIYTKNIYAERNPGVVKELGDVGNDIQIYGNKLYAVVNCSHFVEVMDVRTARHITQISIPNCRYLVFKGRYAYVSSYAGPVQIDPNARLGYVAKVDTVTMSVVGTCTVGYQPEEMVISGNKLYVANSGGYRVPNYDRTVSVIDLDTFREVKKIDVAINLHRLELDQVRPDMGLLARRLLRYAVQNICDRQQDGRGNRRTEIVAQQRNGCLRRFALCVQYRVELPHASQYDQLCDRQCPHQEGRHAEFHYRRNERTDCHTLWYCDKPQYARIFRDGRQGLCDPRYALLFQSRRYEKVVGRNR